MPRRDTAGVNPPGFKRKRKDPVTKKTFSETHTYDWRFTRGDAENTARVWPAALVQPIHQALLYYWRSEAMALRYLVHRPDGLVLERQPRINKPGLAWLEAEGYTVILRTLLVDFDTPGHRDWTPEDQVEFDRIEQNRPPSLAHAGMYTTGRGWRAVQPLTADVPIEEAERVIRAHCLWLERDGLMPDLACSDWTHVFRPPRTFRPEKNCRYDSDPFFQHMTPIDASVVMEHYVPDPADAVRAQLELRRAERQQRAAERRATINAARAAYGNEPLEEEDDDEGDAPGKSRTPRVTMPEWFTRELPPWWKTRAILIGKAVAENIEQTRSAGGHTKMYFALAGALLRNNVPPEHVPEVIRQVDLASGAADDEADEQAWRAEHTVQRFADGSTTTGMTRLRARWPWIARALEASMHVGRVQQDEPERAKLPTLEEGRKRLYDHLRSLGAGEGGPHLVKAPPGTGKTFASCAAATWLARIETEPDGPPFLEGKHTHVVLSFERNDMAIEVIEKMLPARAAVRRFRGSTSRRKDDDAGYECAYREYALMLLKGRQSVRRELCDGRKPPNAPPGPGPNACQHNPLSGGACKAYGSSEVHRPNEHNVRIAVANHAMLEAALDDVGKTGLLIVDEPPPILETVSASLHDIDVAARHATSWFGARFVRAMLPIVRAVEAWALDANTRPDALLRTTFGEVVRTGLELHDPGDRDAMLAAAAVAVHQVYDPTGDAFQQAVGFAGASSEDDTPARAPTVSAITLRTARRNRDRVTMNRIMAASAVFTLFRDATLRIGDPTCEATVRLNETPEREGVTHTRTGLAVLVTMPRAGWLRALKTEARLAILNANAELEHPLLKRVFNWSDAQVQERTFVVEARDAGVVERIFWKRPTSNRGAWLIHGRPVWGSGLANTLKRSISWAAATSVIDRSILDAPLCLVTYRSVRLAIERTLHPEDEELREVWHEAGMTDADFAIAREVLTPILALWRGAWILGHYGAIKGTNRAVEARTFICLGDPFDNFDEVAAEAAWLDVDAEKRWIDLCRAQLEQAFGRARSVCRIDLIRMLHVGTVKPGGPLWESSEVILCTGEPRPDWCTGQNLSLVRERAGWTREQMAVRLGIKPRSLEAYEQGVRVCPMGVFSEAVRITEDFVN